MCFVSFFFNDSATTEIYTLSLHDALPISNPSSPIGVSDRNVRTVRVRLLRWVVGRSEEHTSELQSRLHLVCRLLLEKKKLLRNITPAPPSSSKTTNYTQFSPASKQSQT